MHMPRRNMLAHIHMLPAMMRRRGPRASNMGPIWIPQKKERKMYMLKIPGF